MSNYEKISSIIETMDINKNNLEKGIDEVKNKIVEKEELLKTIQAEIIKFKKDLEEQTNKKSKLETMIEETKKGFKQIQEATNNLFSIIETNYQ